MSQLHIINGYPSRFNEKFQLCPYKILWHFRQVFSVLSTVSISKNAFSLLDGFSSLFIFHFTSNNITEKWCEIDKSVSFLFHSQVHTRMNQRMCMKCRRWKENLENHMHALFYLCGEWKPEVLKYQSPTRLARLAHCCQEHAVICGSSHFLDHKRAWRQESTTEALKKLH